MCPKNPVGCHGVSKTTCFEVPGMSFGESGVSIGGVRILGVKAIFEPFAYTYC